MNADEYQHLALRTEVTPEFVQAPMDGAWDGDGEKMSRLLHGMIGVCTEIGELQDMVKKHLIYGKAFDQVNVLEECGDVLWYVALALDACGCTLSECMERNIAKLKARYPQGFTEEAALTRDLDAERRKLEGK